MTKPMTREDLAVLAEMWKAGETVEAIAARIGRSRRSVLLKRAQLGLPRRRCVHKEAHMNFHISLGIGAAERAKKLACRRGLTFSAFVGDLLQRELEADGS